MSVFNIKICGITRVEDLDEVHAAGADAVGINLVPTSPRYVSTDKAGQLRDRARQLGLKAVIVTMDAGHAELSQLIARLEPDAVQLHGRETPDLLVELLSEQFVVKALSWTGRQEEAELARLWQSAPVKRLAFLVDAYAPGIGGGTGKIARWDLLWPRPAELHDWPLLLAGGLTEDNVGQAILATRCVGVDTASGVESSPGIKSAPRVQKFVTAAKTAWATLAN